MRYADDPNGRNIVVFNKRFLGVLNDNGILRFNLDVVIPGQDTKYLSSGLFFYPANTAIVSDIAL